MILSKSFSVGSTIAWMIDTAAEAQEKKVRPITRA